MLNGCANIQSFLQELRILRKEEKETRRYYPKENDVEFVHLLMEHEISR
jgi:hypothetical protein